jgi:tRNA threonylcarbamoyladenosine biosynthesis protein TsaE
MKIYKLEEIKNINLWLNKDKIIFLKWDLWAWKTTISKHILNNLLKIKENISSPTYTYYNKYWKNYHFDLYRLKNYDEFFAIWWEEILDNNSWIILIEWPDIIEKYYKADIVINIKKTDNENEREIEIIKK